MITKLKDLVVLGLVVAGGMAPSAWGAQDCDVAAIVWPAYQPEPRWAELGIFNDGKGEWQNVYECKRCTKPLWGYENEADPTVVARKIDAALAAGVNVFIYDWYWYGGRPFLEDGLDKGFLKAPNSARMKFYVMYANHDVDQTWNNKVPTKDKRKLLWPAKISDADWAEIVRRLVAYFRLPNYYTIDGRPVFWLYRSDDFIAWDGLEKAQARLRLLRDEVVKAGFPGLHLQISASASKGHLVERLPEHIREVGADSVTTYNWLYRSWNQIFSEKLPPMTYRAWGELAMTNMAEAAMWTKKGGARWIPNLSMGFNNCSRWPEPESLTRRGVVERTPQAFEAFARRIRKWTDENTEPGERKLVIVNSWNEWTEDSYLEPDDKFGYGYLNALWRVFSAPKTL
ncbi:MAG: glycoside hydrolase family 99-like domain-containing protein [Kiritimatiellae bacterium]|nr:glycoside hydrolase family 99-like domain-containing protein [Kiritimatiellia bacterium]